MGVSRGVSIGGSSPAGYGGNASYQTGSLGFQAAPGVGFPGNASPYSGGYNPYGYGGTANIGNQFTGYYGPGGSQGGASNDIWGFTNSGYGPNGYVGVPYLDYQPDEVIANRGALGANPVTSPVTAPSAYGGTSQGVNRGVTGGGGGGGSTPTPPPPVPAPPARYVPSSSGVAPPPAPPQPGLYDLASRAGGYDPYTSGVLGNVAQGLTMAGDQAEAGSGTAFTQAARQRRLNSIPIELRQQANVRTAYDDFLDRVQSESGVL